MPEEITNETTNAVLKEMIIGLTKITDDRLLNLKEGIADIKILMQGFASKTEVADLRKEMIDSLKRIETWQTNHEVDDKGNFGKLVEGQDSLKGTFKYWAGALAAIAIALPIIVPLMLHYWFHIG